MAKLAPGMGSREVLKIGSERYVVFGIENMYCQSCRGIELYDVSQFGLLVIIMPVGRKDKDDHHIVMDFVDQTVFLGDCARPLPAPVTF